MQEDLQETRSSYLLGLLSPWFRALDVYAIRLTLEIQPLIFLKRQLYLFQSRIISTESALKSGIRRCSMQPIHEQA